MQHPRAPSHPRRHLSSKAIMGQAISPFPTSVLVSTEKRNNSILPLPGSPYPAEASGPCAITLLLPAPVTCCVQGHLTSYSGSTPRDQPVLETFLSEERE